MNINITPREPELQADTDELREELANALAASRYETDLCQQALDSRDELQKEVESLKAVIASFNPLLAAAKLTLDLSHSENAALKADAKMWEWALRNDEHMTLNIRSAYRAWNGEGSFADYCKEIAGVK